MPKYYRSYRAVTERLTLYNINKNILKSDTKVV